MPWNETTKMRERVRFIGDLERALFFHDRAVPALRDQPGDRAQVGQPVFRGGPERPEGSTSSARVLPQSGRRLHRRMLTMPTRPTVSHRRYATGAAHGSATALRSTEHGSQLDRSRPNAQLQGAPRFFAAPLLDRVIRQDCLYSRLIPLTRSLS